MGVLLRYDPAEQVLRSVDDHPGIVGCGQPFPDDPDRFAFYVSSSWAPSEGMKTAGRKIVAAGGVGMLGEVLNTSEMKGAAGLDLDDVAAGCESQLELAICIQIVQAMVSGAANHFVADLAFSDLALAAQFGEQALTTISRELIRRREAA